MILVHLAGFHTGKGTLTGGSRSFKKNFLKKVICFFNALKVSPATEIPRNMPGKLLRLSEFWWVWRLLLHSHHTKYLNANFRGEGEFEPDKGYPPLSPAWSYLYQWLNLQPSVFRYGAIVTKTKHIIMCMYMTMHAIVIQWVVN